MTVGLPGSGKSTWLARRGVVPLSTDYVRQLLLDDPTDQSQQFAVFNVVRYLLRVRLSLRRPVTYIDATNLDRHERRGWFKFAEMFGCCVDAVFFDVPVKVCMQRNAGRDRNVPLEAMQRMAAKLRPPTYEEGFRKIWVVDSAGRTRLMRRRASAS